MDQEDLPPQPEPKPRERVPAPPMPAEIAKAIIAVMKKTGVLARDGKNTHGGYQYASVDAFYEAIAPITAEENLIIYASAINHRYDKFTGKNGDIKVAVTIDYTFGLIHATSGTSWNDPNDVKQIRLWWSGAQTFGAGESYAIKQFMRGLFKIPTGDRDADENDQRERTEVRDAPEVHANRRANGRRSTSKVVAFDIGARKRTLAMDEIKEELFPYLEGLSRDQLRAWNEKNKEAIATAYDYDKSVALSLKELLEEKLG